MPIATSSRRGSNKRRASSDIEDADTSQSRGDRVTNEEHSRRHANGVKKERKAVKQEPSHAGENDDDNDNDDEDERIDVENFTDQPLGRTDVSKLQGLARDWSGITDKVRPNWQVVGEAAVALVDTGEGAEVDDGLEELDRLMKDLIDISAEMQSHEKVLDELAQRVAQGEKLENFIDHYSTGIQERKEAYSKTTSRQKYAKSEEYATFKNNIFEALHPDTPIPPITEFIPKEPGDDSDDDDELEMGGVSQNYNCPITLTLLEDPVTSDVCKHSFSKAAIMQSFRGGEPSIRCPAAGCTKRFSRANLKPNKDLAKKVKAHERRARRAAENDDAEEIID
ncbi:hypothetical protein H0H92_015172 [Tricholoma furcatifolium]|nr:hypothetical protein H0H92_015172 [Tricholoma furcatifolium]